VSMDEDINKRCQKSEREKTYDKNYERNIKQLKPSLCSASSYLGHILHSKKI